jgi:hypothetical protein
MAVAWLARVVMRAAASCSAAALRVRLERLQGCGHEDCPRPATSTKPYLFSSNHETHEIHERKPKPGRRPNPDHLPKIPVTIQCSAPRLGKQWWCLSFRVFRVFRGSAFCMDTAKVYRWVWRSPGMNPGRDGSNQGNSARLVQRHSDGLVTAANFPLRRSWRLRQKAATAPGRDGKRQKSSTRGDGGGSCALTGLGPTLNPGPGRPENSHRQPP